MRRQQGEPLIGPHGDPPPFARSRAETPRGVRGALPTATWRPLITQTCDTWSVDPIRTEAMMLLESAGQDLDPNDSGAVGLMQIIPAEWPELCAAVCQKHGVPNELPSLRRPEINVEIGVRELKWWIEVKCGGSGDGGSCAYFSGHCVPNGAKDDFGTTDFRYVEIIQENMALVRNDIGGGSPDFHDGDQIKVVDGPLHLREHGNLQGAILDSLAAGTLMIVTGGPVQHDGYTWYRVDVAGGDKKGWVAGLYCRLAS